MPTIRPLESASRRLLLRLALMLFNLRMHLVAVGELLQLSNLPLRVESHQVHQFHPVFFT